MKTEIIQDYYQQRGLGWPDQKSALLFYLSEVGELAEAYLSIQPVELSVEEQDLLNAFAKLGLQADEIVSRKPGWVRNNDRIRKENIAHEAADCNMMLSVFLETYCGQSPDMALLEKMALKLGHPISEVEQD
jgi:NTP pyrophosphatase (non-canonical NTP hydrolase)